MGRRVGTLRGALGLAIAALLAVAGCGGGNPDPYAVLDQARTANYDRIRVNLGFTVDVAPQLNPNFPDGQMPATSINVDPSLITAAAEITTGRWYVRLAVPLDALGMGNQGIPLGCPSPPSTSRRSATARTCSSRARSCPWRSRALAAHRSEAT